MSMRSLWAAVQEDPVFMRKLNGHLTLHWLCHFPVVIFLYFAFPDTWDKISILYLALVSIYANVAGHLSAWQAARVEVRQEEIAKESGDTAPQSGIITPKGEDDDTID